MSECQTYSNSCYCYYYYYYNYYYYYDYDYDYDYDILGGAVASWLVRLSPD